MKKKMFFALTIFVIFFTTIACKVAVDELADLRENPPSETNIVAERAS